MYGGAWRAWQRAPWLGIGAGMHQHLWPEVAASGDGDRDAGIWPTLVNDDFHSYEVHSDWLQLLEEYGLIGFFLFLAPVIWLLRGLLLRLDEHSRPWRENELDAIRDRTPQGYYRVLAAGLAVGAMIFHSLGDFNLQMPGTVWLLAAIVGIGLGARPLTKEA